ncbi:MAG TPA: hypothetical protein VF620_15060 [Allosphingosinicella sp.]|jgi:hypothetical protein
MTAAAFLLAAALLVQETESEEPTANHGGAYGWRCSAEVAIGRHRGSVWRDYDERLIPSPYIIQVQLPDPADRQTTSWMVDPRHEGPPPGQKRNGVSGVREADAFRNGPGSVQFELKWEPVELAGPLWVHYWGDGRHAGTRMMASARHTRRDYARRHHGTAIGVHPDRDLIAKLASASRWTAVAVDSTGKLFASKTIEVPTPQQAEAAFREARARIDSLERRFAANHEPREEGGASCSDHEDPAATI